MGYQLSKKEILKEVVKAGKDPDYFINNYAKISHPMRGLIPFKTYDFQSGLIDSFNEHRFTVILKARQLGISTITAAYIAWMMMFHRDKNILVIATKFSTASNLVKKVKSIIKYLPEWLRISNIEVDNRTSFELTNGSQIKASSTSGDAGRSEALSLLVIDEAAHVEGLDELWTGLYPTLSTGGRCIALSTPNGVGNWFHQAYVNAEEEKNDFFPIRIPWDMHPDRDQEWFDKETKNMSRRQIAQELECNFNMSGETVFHPDDMKRIVVDLCEPKYRTGFDRNFWIWEEYSSEFTYLLSADVARGDGADYSTFHIFKIETMEIIGEYKGKITPDLFSNLLYDTGNEYGSCMVAVENNSVGFAVIEKLKDRGYPNIYYSYKSSHEYVDPLIGEYKSNAVAGFTTSLKSRPLIIAKMEEFIRNKLVKIYSKRLYNEMETFVWHSGKPQAMKKYNDDLIMACAIGCWVKDMAFEAGQRDTEYKKAMLDSMIKTNSSMNTTIPGMIGHKMVKEDRDKRQNQEFLWLLKG
tara:strand:+ start:37232 stop:38806 length:1575 start_codon:yes stop_codon:yes gene_type:complete